MDNEEHIKEAFRGIGVDERSLLSVFGKLKEEEIRAFQNLKMSSFLADQHHCGRIGNVFLESKLDSFQLFQTALIMLSQHPAERDATLLRSAFVEGREPKNIFIEVLCTRENLEIARIRDAYLKLYNVKLEEEVRRANITRALHRDVLLGLIWGLHYEDPPDYTKEDVLKDSIMLRKALRGCTGYIGHSEWKDALIRLLTVEDKTYLCEVIDEYEANTAVSIFENMQIPEYLRLILKCVSRPVDYFSEIAVQAFKADASHEAKEALIRVIVTRTGVDLSDIKAKTSSLENMVRNEVKGHCKDFLLNILANN